MVGGIAVAPLIPILLGSIGGANLILFEGTSIGLSSKKKKIYREICLAVELGISKLFIFQQKALADKILTNEEIEQSRKIVLDIKNEIQMIKNKSKG